MSSNECEKSTSGRVRSTIASLLVRRPSLSAAQLATARRMVASLGSKTRRRPTAVPPRTRDGHRKTSRCDLSIRAVTSSSALHAVQFAHIAWANSDAWSVLWGSARELQACSSRWTTRRPCCGCWRQCIPSSDTARQEAPRATAPGTPKHPIGAASSGPARRRPLSPRCRGIHSKWL